MNKKLIITTLIFTAVTIIARMLPHVPNVAPMAALALFSGVYLPKRWSIVVPVIAMFISDIFVGFYTWEVMAAVYLGFILTVIIGWQVGKKVNPLSAIGGSLSGSIFFFLLTNAAVWAFGQMYPHTIAGLVDSYVMGLPFFKFSLVGDLAWTTVFFAAYQLVLKYFPAIDLKKIEAAGASPANV